ncbi:MAG: hypothetical protein HKO07_03390 [Pseudomonadales bacterium]|nr:hypothetical protein [Pseudomonadales bacterium]
MLLHSVYSAAPKVFCALCLLVVQACGTATSAAVEHNATCRYVVDGDSLYLAGVKAQIRLWGVDAPERGEP